MVYLHYKVCNPSDPLETINKFIYKCLKFDASNIDIEVVLETYNNSLIGGINLLEGGIYWDVLYL